MVGAEDFSLNSITHIRGYYFLDDIPGIFLYFVLAYGFFIEHFCTYLFIYLFVVSHVFYVHLHWRMCTQLVHAREHITQAIIRGCQFFFFFWLHNFLIRAAFRRYIEMWVHTK